MITGPLGSVRLGTGPLGTGPVHRWTALEPRPTWVIAWVLGWVLGGLQIAAAAESPRWESRGKGHEDHPLLPALLRRAEESLRDALQRLPQELGFAPDVTRIRWVLDVSPHVSTLRKGAWKKENEQEQEQAQDEEQEQEQEKEKENEKETEKEPFEAGRTCFAEPVVEVVIPARRFLRHPDEVKPVVLHEAAHAALASRLRTRERYLGVPSWFREGIALAFSGEGELRLEERIADTVFRGAEAGSFLVGVPASKVPEKTVPGEEAWLAVVWIETQAGKDGVRRLCAEAARGRPLEECIEGLLGKPRELISAAMLLHARRRVEELLPPRRERVFRDSLARHDVDGAMEAWRALLVEDAEGPLAGTLHYLLGREYARQPGPEGRREARRHLEGLLSTRTALWRPEALVLLGECLRADGKEPEARALWEEVLEAYGEDEIPAARARKGLEAPAR